MEKYGSGIRRIVEGFAEYGLPAPRFQEISDGFMVTVYNGQGGRLELQLESLSQRVLNLLKDGAQSKSELSARLGQKAVSGQLHAVVKALLKSRLIEYTIPERPQSRLQKYRLPGKGLQSGS